MGNCTQTSTILWMYSDARISAEFAVSILRYMAEKYSLILVEYFVFPIPDSYGEWSSLPELRAAHNKF